MINCVKIYSKQNISSIDLDIENIKGLVSIVLKIYKAVIL